jgi:hypothetical protein
VVDVTPPPVNEGVVDDWAVAAVDFDDGVTAVDDADPEGTWDVVDVLSVDASDAATASWTTKAPPRPTTPAAANRAAEPATARLRRCRRTVTPTLAWSSVASRRLSIQELSSYTFARLSIASHLPVRVRQRPCQVRLGEPSEIGGTIL